METALSNKPDSQGVLESKSSGSFVPAALLSAYTARA
jgi:hypothetical protein